MEVEVEGRGVDQVLGAQPRDPRPQQPHDRLPAEAGGVLRHEGGLGHGVEAHGQRDALVEEQIHHVAAARLAEQLEDQRRPHRIRGGDHRRARELAARHHGVEVEPGQQGQEQEQAPDARGEHAGRQRELPDIGDRLGQRPRAPGALLVGPAGQPREALRPQHFLDRGDAEPARAGAVEFVADVVDGEVALAQGNHAGAHRVLAGLGFRPVRARAEEVPVHLVPEAPAEDAEGPGLVAEPAGHLGRRGAVGEVGAQRLVLALARLARFQEEPGGFRYRIWCCLDASILWLVTPADQGNRAGRAFYEVRSAPKRTVPARRDRIQSSNAMFQIIDLITNLGRLRKPLRAQSGGRVERRCYRNWHA